MFHDKEIATLYAVTGFNQVDFFLFGHILVERVRVRVSICSVCSRGTGGIENREGLSTGYPLLQLQFPAPRGELSSGGNCRGKFYATFAGFAGTGIASTRIHNFSSNLSFSSVMLMDFFSHRSVSMPSISHILA